MIYYGNHFHLGPRQPQYQIEKLSQYTTVVTTKTIRYFILEEVSSTDSLPGYN